MQHTRYEQDFQHLRIAVLRSHGDAGTDLCEHIEARAAQLSGRTIDHREILPPPLGDFVDKVAQHAYKVTDADFHDLERAGYSEDAIFEITVCAAVGAGSARFEQAMAALNGAADTGEGEPA